MACEYKVPDGRDFESVFARGRAGVDTGYKNIVGDDLGSYFAGGGSEVKTGMLTPEGVDLGKIFMPRGDANLKLLYVLAQTSDSWVRVQLDLRRNSWWFSNQRGGKIISQTLDQDLLLHAYNRLMAGYRLVFEVHWGRDDMKNTNGEGVVAPMGFRVLNYPTTDNPWFIWEMGLGDTRKKNVTFEVICNAYLH